MGKSTRIVFGIIITVSVVLRVVTTFYLGDQVVILPGTHDQLSYHRLALRVLGGHGFTFGEPWWPATSANEPTAMWSYLYTFYLVFIYTVFGPHPLAARLIQALIVGLIHPLLVYLIARRIFGETVGLVAAALTSIYAYFIYYAATLMTEPFYITALLGALYIAIRLVDHTSDPDRGTSHGRTLAMAIGLGMTLGIAVLLRQLFLLLIPIIFLWVWWASRKRGGRSSIFALLIAGMLVVTFILPFTYYNYTRFGRFVLLNTNAGYAFYWSNHPVHGIRFIPARELKNYQRLIPSELRSLDEAALDQELLKRGLQFILDDPVRYMLLSISRIPEYFRFWPSSDSSPLSNIARMGSFGLLLFFILLGVGFWLRESSNYGLRKILQLPEALLLSYVIIYAGIHLLSWALIRYRLPIDAVLIIFAGLAIIELKNRFIVRRDLHTTTEYKATSRDGSK